MLPDFVFCENKQSLPGAGIVLYTKPPYWTGQVIKFSSDAEMLAFFEKNKIQAAGQLLTYHIAVVHSGNLQAIDVQDPQGFANDMARIYRRMADFYYEERIVGNESRFKRYLKK